MNILWPQGRVLFLLGFFFFGWLARCYCLSFSYLEGYLPFVYLSVDMFVISLSPIGTWSQNRDNMSRVSDARALLALYTLYLCRRPRD